MNWRTFAVLAVVGLLLAASVDCKKPAKDSKETKEPSKNAKKGKDVKKEKEKGVEKKAKVEVVDAADVEFVDVHAHDHAHHAHHAHHDHHAPHHVHHAHVHDQAHSHAHHDAHAAHQHHEEAHDAHDEGSGTHTAHRQMLKPKTLKVLTAYEHCKLECRRQRDEVQAQEYVEQLRHELNAAEAALKAEEEAGRGAHSEAHQEEAHAHIEH